MVGFGDAVLGFLLALFLFFGFRRGISLGLFTTGGVVVVFVGAAMLAGPLGKVLERQVSLEEATATGVCFIVVLVAGLGLLAGLRSVLKRQVLQQPEGVLNSLTGALVWGALGAVLIILCLSVLLVSHRDVFDRVAYDRSAACRFLFDRAPVVRNLKARLDQPRKPAPKQPSDLEELQKGFGPAPKDEDEPEADR